MLMGVETAKNLGIRADRTILWILIISSFVVAAVVANTGVIGFVGLIIPHIIRLLVGSDNRKILPFIDYCRSYLFNDNRHTGANNYFTIRTSGRKHYRAVWSALFSLPIISITKTYAMIEVEKLNITLSDKSILNEINLSFKEGQFYCIAGPNGSGKTTLLRTLTKVLAINNRVIFIDNEDINTISQKKISQKIGFVPQSSTLDCDFTAFDVVMMGRSPYQHPLQNDSIQDVRIVKEAMDFTDTWHFTAYTRTST